MTILTICPSSLFCQLHPNHLICCNTLSISFCSLSISHLYWKMICIFFCLPCRFRINCKKPVEVGMFPHLAISHFLKLFSCFSPIPTWLPFCPHCEICCTHPPRDIPKNISSHCPLNQPIQPYSYHFSIWTYQDPHQFYHIFQQQEYFSF